MFSSRSPILSVEYVPKGPCEVAKVRHFAELKLRQVLEAPQLLNDKTRFLNYMEGLTNDILGVGNERSSATARAGKPQGGGPSLIQEAVVGGGASYSGYVAEPISADLREPSYTALSKLQHIRQNVAAMLGGEASTTFAAPGAREQGRGGASTLEQRHTRGEMLRPPCLVESKSSTEYPFTSSKGQKSSAAESFEREEDLVTDKENNVEKINNLQLPRRAPSPTRRTDGHAVSTAESDRIMAPAQAELNAERAPEVPSSEPTFAAANPRIEDGELDFSGTWKSTKGECGRYKASIDTKAVNAGEGAPQTTITLRGSVDLSGMSLEGFKSLTGHY